MRPFTKFLRTQLSFFKGFLSNCSLETARRNQDRLGKLMASFHKSDVSYEDFKIGEMEASLLTPMPLAMLPSLPSMRALWL